MCEAKYIVTYQNRLEAIFMFPNFVTHSEFAERMSLSHSAVLSAGFVAIGVDANGETSISTYGESISLDKKSRPEDKRLAERMFRVNC